MCNMCHIKDAMNKHILLEVFLKNMSLKHMYLNQILHVSVTYAFKNTENLILLRFYFKRERKYFKQNTFFIETENMYYIKHKKYYKASCFISMIMSF